MKKNNSKIIAFNSFAYKPEDTTNTLNCALRTVGENSLQNLMSFCFVCQIFVCGCVRLCIASDSQNKGMTISTWKGN